MTSVFIPSSKTGLLYSFRICSGSAMVLSLVLGLVCHPAAGHCQTPRLDDARLCHRPGRGHAALTGLIWVLIFGTLGEPYKGWLMAPVGLSTSSWPNDHSQEACKGFATRKAPCECFGPSSIQATCLIEGGFSHESDYLHTLWTTRSASAQRG